MLSLPSVIFWNGHDTVNAVPEIYHASYSQNNIFKYKSTHANGRYIYSISQEIYTRFSLCFALLWLCNHSYWIHMKYLSIFIRVALLALGQSLDCHSASEVSLMDMGKSVNVQPQQSTAKQKPCAYFLGYTVLLPNLFYMGNQIYQNWYAYCFTFSFYFLLDLFNAMRPLHVYWTLIDRYLGNWLLWSYVSWYIRKAL